MKRILTIFVTLIITYPCMATNPIELCGKAPGEYSDNLREDYIDSAMGVFSNLSGLLRARSEDKAGRTQCYFLGQLSSEIGNYKLQLKGIINFCDLTVKDDLNQKAVDEMVTQLQDMEAMCGVEAPIYEARRISPVNEGDVTEFRSRFELLHEHITGLNDSVMPLIER